MKSYERESFLKVFIIFLLVLSVLWSIIFYLYYKENEDYMNEDLYYQMKNYAFDFKGDKFSLDIIKINKNIEFSKLYNQKEGLLVYFPMPKNDKYMLKILYDKNKYQANLNALKIKTLKLALIILFISLIFSFYFAIYSLKPMKNALQLLDMFLKDLIHDLHTPITSILLNAKLLSRKEKSEELERIELSAKNILSLYKNLEILKNKTIEKTNTIDVKEIIEEKVKVLEKIYPKIKITKRLNPLYINSNEDAISRILENILTNACKYNKKNGEVTITAHDKKIIIEDTGIGIKNTKKIFDSYYKENERGLGLGMNIVKRLCDELNIKIKIESEINKGTIVELTLN
ncbi:MAG: HAMP domain-containing sensor histidine kinase [Sulfurospirillaceae bacterium]|nr:HAMP domain-containing sensor histidine kinase [Sulfurospirillaceae bacterium]